MSGAAELEPVSGLGWSGMNRVVLRREDLRLLTGKGCFTDDMDLPGQAYGYFLRSPHAHARIVALDDRPARRAPGVLGIYTGSDLKKAALGHITCVAPVQNRDGTTMPIPPRPAMTADRVRFVGDIIAMVVAESTSLAMDAAALIEVDFETLDAVVDPATALDPEAPRLWDFAVNNRAFDWCLGDLAKVEAAFGQAKRIVRLQVVNNRVIPNSMEPRAALGSYDSHDGRLTLHAGCQGGHLLRRALAQDIFKVPEDRIRVITKDVGGSFGMKGYLYPEYVCTLFAARALGRPVKWTCERSDSFLSDTHGRDHVTEVELAMDSEGHFLAVKASVIANLGAYLSDFAPLIPAKGSSLLVGTYKIPAAFVEVRGVYTNTCPLDAYRGAGRPEASFAIERTVDVAARELGLAPDEIRRRNFIPRSEMPYKTALGHIYDGGDFAGNLETALEAADWAGIERRRGAAARSGKLRGIGMTCYIDACGGAPAVGARIEFDSDGGVSVFVGSQNNGQGQETLYAQLAAERLAVPFESVSVVQGDTDLVPGGFTGGSRGLTVGGTAVVLAADGVIAQGKTLAAQLLQSPLENTEYRNGRFGVVGTDRSLGLLEIVDASFKSPELPSDVSPGLAEAVIFTPDAPTYPNGCHIAEVEIDPETGVVRVVGYATADDFGRIANAMLVSGQVHGGVVQGIGQALHEAGLYDPKSGQLITGSFVDYCLPRADDVPPFRLSFNEIPCTTNPLGAKGCAEAGTVAAPAAVINAVVDALRSYGVRHIDMPATPEKVWRAIARRGLSA